MNTRIFLCVTILTLAGCGTTTHLDSTEGKAHLKATRPCCSSFSQLPEIPFEHRAIVALDKNASVLALPDGKTFAALIKLPDDRDWSELLLSSYPNSIHTGAYFRPIVTILNEDKHPVRTLPHTLFRWTPESWTEPPHLKGVLQLSADPENEKFLAIYTVPIAMNASETVWYSSDGDALFGIPPIPIMKRGSSVGKIRLSIMR